jgi:hypothetical protein
MNGHMADIFLCKFCILVLLDLLAVDKMDLYTVSVRTLAQIPGARSPGRPNFLQSCLIVVGPKCRTCFMSHFDVAPRFLENSYNPVHINK